MKICKNQYTSEKSDGGLGEGVNLLHKRQFYVALAKTYRYERLKENRDISLSDKTF